MYGLLDQAAKITQDNPDFVSQGYCTLTLITGEKVDGRIDLVYEPLADQFEVTVVDRPDSDYARHIRLDAIIAFEFSDPPEGVK